MGVGTRSPSTTGGSYDDWRWDMPDEGRWELSRLELSSPVFDGERLLVGNSRSPGLFVLDRIVNGASASVVDACPDWGAP